MQMHVRDPCAAEGCVIFELASQNSVFMSWIKGCWWGFSQASRDMCRCIVACCMIWIIALHGPAAQNLGIGWLVGDLPGAKGPETQMEWQYSVVTTGSLLARKQDGLDL